MLLRANIAMRLRGWYSLEVQTMGRDVRQQGAQVIVPFDRIDVALDVARRVRSFEFPSTFNHVSRLMVRRLFLRYMLLVAVPVVLAAWFLDVRFAWALLALTLLWPIAELEFRHHGYALVGSTLVVRRGFWRRRIWIVPLDRVQVLQRRADVFQRRLGLQTLEIDTAGSSTLDPPSILNLEASVAESLVEHQLHEADDGAVRDRGPVHSG